MCYNVAVGLNAAKVVIKFSQLYKRFKAVSYKLLVENFSWCKTAKNYDKKPSCC